MKAGYSEPWFAGRAARSMCLLMLCASAVAFLFSSPCGFGRRTQLQRPVAGASSIYAGKLAVPITISNKVSVTSGVASTTGSSSKPTVNNAPATGPANTFDAGPFADIFIKLAEKHRAMQHDILSGKVPLKRAIIAHCGRSQVCAGHGDRAFGILVLYLAAILTDRAFFMDYSKPLPMEDFMEPNKLEWRIGAIKNKTMQSKVAVCATSKEPVFQDCNFHDILLPGAQCRHIIGTVFSDNPFLVINSDHRTECVQKLLEKNSILPPKGQHGYQGTKEQLQWWAANVSHIMSDWLFKFKPEIVAAGEKSLVLPNTKARVPPECLVCVHVRSGSGVGERGRHTNWADFANCAQAANADLAKHKQCPVPATWLIVGDNTNAADEISKHIKTEKKPTVLSTNALGKPTHLDQNNAATKDMVAHVFVDWYLLSRCRYMVASLSTFGATASLISGPRVRRYDMEVAGHAGGCQLHTISDWQRDANA